MLIRVAAPPKTAFNQNRPISDLIKSQVEHLKHLEERLPAEQRSTIPEGAIVTEADAARYIAAMTAVLKGDTAVAQTPAIPKVRSIRTPVKKATKKSAKKAPGTGRKLAIAASASPDKKKTATLTKTKTAKKKETSRGRKKK
jgi:hypothetical protein